MTEEIVIKEVELTKLKLRIGEVLVVKLPSDTKHNWMQKLGMQLTRLLPRNQCLIICNDQIEFSVISAEEAEALKEAQRGRKA